MDIAPKLVHTLPVGRDRIAAPDRKQSPVLVELHVEDSFTHVAEDTLTLRFTILGKPPCILHCMTARKETKPRPPLHDRLNALLHTMRCIELQEPQLCALLHELKMTGKVTPKLTADLRAVLDRVPVDGFAADMEALELALNE